MKFKRLTIVSLIVITGILIFILPTLAAEDTNKQTIDIKVWTNEIPTNPKVTWYQLDNGYFRADYYGSNNQKVHIDTPYVGTRQDPYPKDAEVRNRTNVMAYFTGQFLGENGVYYNKNEVHSYEIVKAEFNPLVKSYEGVNLWWDKNEPDHLIYIVKTGHSFEHEKRTRYGTSPSGHPKFSIEYLTPLIVQWEGIVKETKEIRVLKDHTMVTNETFDMKAEIRTRTSKTSWGKWEDVTKDTPHITWTSSKPHIASVDEHGRVKAHSKGETVISARWKKGQYNIVASAVITVNHDYEPGFRVDPKNVRMEVGESEQLSALYFYPGLGEFNVSNVSEWKSSASWIASVDKGKVTCNFIGTATITATYVDGYEDARSDTAEIECYENVKIYGPPVADFTFSPSNPTTNDTIQFTDQSYHPEGLQIVKWEWEIDGHRFETQHPSYRPPINGVFYAILTVTDENGLQDTVAKPVPVIDPPVAIIEAPTSVKAGDPVLIDGTKSFDPNGYNIEEYRWTISDTDDQINGSKGTVTFMEETRARVDLSVRNEVDLWGSTTHYIDVLPPTPIAKFKVSGHLKENRKVMLDDMSETPLMYPVDWDKSYFTIEPLDGQSNDVIKYHGELNKEHIDVLFKEIGKYRVSLYIENTYGLSDETSQIIEIKPDEVPEADFSTPDTIYRDPNNKNLATINIVDNSRSHDDDIVQQRIWMYRYDSKNQYRTDGNFESEEWIIVDDTNKTSIQIEVPDVGYYEVRVFVKEDFGQPTIEDFINDDDYRTKMSVSKVIKVDNHAPQIEWLKR